MSKLTYWKQERNPNYLGSFDLIINCEENYKPIYTEKIVTIKKITKEDVIDMENIKKNPKAQKKQTIVYCEEFDRPMIISSVCNFKGLVEATGIPFSNYWYDGKANGKKAILWVEKNVKAFGKITDALRIKKVTKFTCDICKKVIDEKTWQMSIDKYGIALCSAECKEKAMLTNFKKEKAEKITLENFIENLEDEVENENG